MDHSQRARSDAQKQQRRQAILDSAWQLFQTAPYDAITVATIAQQLGLAKGTIYLYYTTKEELFLAVLQQQLAQWFDGLNTRLSDSMASPQLVATLIVDSVLAQPGFTSMLAILHPIIEQNISAAAARQFKLFLRDRLAQTGALIEAQVVSLPAGGGAQLLLWAYALMIGMKHLSNPPPIVQAVLQEDDLAALDVDFGTAFSAALGALFRGFNKFDE